MIIDSSALVAILRAEPEQEAFAEIIVRAGGGRLSAASYLETAIVIDRARDPVTSRALDSFLAGAAISIEAVTAQQARIAREAWRDFGKGSGHAAQLNFGDCLTYALAKEREEPVLFKGHDFSHTDLAIAARP
jgi:ribonuclease VapC